MELIASRWAPQEQSAVGLTPELSCEGLAGSLPELVRDADGGHHLESKAPRRLQRYVRPRDAFMAALWLPS
jgi:hypothetical protein